jgi:ribokinase
MPRVCVIGSANVDFTVALPRLPRPGETVSGGTLLANLGGKGANQAVAARKLGAEVRLIGGVGDDSSGVRIRDRLGSLGIDVAGLQTVHDAATGTALILVDADGRNQIGVAPGANHRLSLDMVGAHEAAIEWADVLVCQLETPLEVVRWGLERASRHGVVTILNPAPVQVLPDDLLGLVTYLTPNAGEAGALAGTDVGDLESARDAALRLMERGAEHVLVTLGEDGVLACDPDRALHFPASRSRRWTPPPPAMPSTARWRWALPRAADSRRPSRLPTRPLRSPARGAGRRTPFPTAWRWSGTSARSVNADRAPARRRGLTSPARRAQSHGQWR